jgi:ubiquinone/menaquinone biosynthesis C-methylase UbiE
VPKVFPLAHYLLGVEGLALLRSWLVGDEASSRARLTEIADVCAGWAARPREAAVTVAEVPVRDGYADWSAGYDEAPNAVMVLADRAIGDALSGLPAGRALDVACGTGRQTERLLALGHEVTGVDTAPAMITRARHRLPGAQFAVGDLTALPVSTAGFDLVTCCLALAHQPGVAGPVGEFRRVLRPGGHAIVCDVHPTLVLLGGHAVFPLGEGRVGVMRNDHHPHAEYLAAFTRNGFDVVHCAEPVFTGESRVSASAAALLPEATRAAFDGLPAVLLWVLRRTG